MSFLNRHFEQYFEIPDVPADRPAVFYGSARFILNAIKSQRWQPCAYFDDMVFRFSFWSDKYSGHVLNRDAQVVSMRTLAETPRSDEELIFVRPNRDLKEFAGQVMSFYEYRKWFEKIDTLGDEADINSTTEIVAASPKDLGHEWRLFMVEGRYCSGSHYRCAGRLEVNPDVPKEVIDFAHNTAAIWQPDEVYAVDIGEIDGKLSVVEINGFNSTGFYSSDIQTIVSSVTLLAEG